MKRLLHRLCAARALHYVLVAAFVAPMLACPSDLPSATGYTTQIEVPDGTAKASIDVWAEVPEGEWGFVLGGVSATEIETDLPLDARRDEHVSYRNYPRYEDAGAPELSGSAPYRLRCPEKLCRFLFTIRGVRETGLWRVHASFVIKNPDPDQGAGCGTPEAEPNHADEATVQRLFKVEHELYDVVPAQEPAIDL